MSREEGRPRRVVLISYHYLGSERRAGFHWLADAFWRMGWDVTFVTAPISWISWLRRNERFRYPVRQEANQLRGAGIRLSSYVLFTRFHPVDLRLRLLNRLSTPLALRYERTPLAGLEERLGQSDLVVVESTAALLLLNRIRAVAPRARLVYRVSDPLELVGAPPAVQRWEMEVASRFDLISVPSEYLLRRFAGASNVRLHYHGVAREPYDRPVGSPYDGDVNVCFTGNSHFDADAVEAAARLLPHWRFHVIGRVRAPRLPNVLSYGELPFEETVPFVKHADIGLQTRVHDRGAEALTDSLKVLQYTYCGLPVVAPDFLTTVRENVFYYSAAAPDSIGVALERARAYGRHPELRHGVPSWSDVARALAGDLAQRVHPGRATPEEDWVARA